MHMMETDFLVILLWTTTVYQIGCEATRGKPKRNHLSESEPHPYTISFFTFQNGAASELIKPKIQSKRQNEDSQLNQNEAKSAKQATDITKKSETSIPNSSEAGDKSGLGKAPYLQSSAPSKSTKKASQTAGGHLRHAHEKTKHPHQFVQVYGKPTAIEKAGKMPEVGPQKGHQKMETWKLGQSHNKIQFKVHQKETNEPYQAGSINHPLHTTYPECHHCSSNSTYDTCTSKTTLAKCNKGLNNICFTKSFRSDKRGIVYEMGCSSHRQCKEAKASPCKGDTKKCFVCCQYNGCNAVPHHHLFSKSSDETGFEFLNSKAVRCLSSKWNAVLMISLQLMVWMM